MFIINSKEFGRINTHYCYSQEVCDLVYNYIKGKYGFELEVKEIEGVPYYDCGGARLIDSFFTNVKLANIECRIDDLGLLVELMEGFNKKFDKGFYRIGSFFGNLCYSEREIEEIKTYIQENKEMIERIEEDVDDYFDKKYPRIISAKQG